MNTANTGEQNSLSSSRLMVIKDPTRTEGQIISDLKAKLECVMNQGGILSPQAQNIVEKIRIELGSLGLSKAEVSEIGT